VTTRARRGRCSVLAVEGRRLSVTPSNLLNVDGVYEYEISAAEVSVTRSSALQLRRYSGSLRRGLQHRVGQVVGLLRGKYHEPDVTPAQSGHGAADPLRLAAAAGRGARRHRLTIPSSAPDGFSYKHQCAVSTSGASRTIHGVAVIHSASSIPTHPSLLRRESAPIQQNPACSAVWMQLGGLLTATPPPQTPRRRRLDIGIRESRRARTATPSPPPASAELNQIHIDIPPFTLLRGSSVEGYRHVILRVTWTDSAVSSTGARSKGTETPGNAAQAGFSE